MDYLLVRGSQSPAVQELRTALCNELGADAQDFPGLDQGDEMTVDVEAAARRWQSGVGLVADGVVGPYCLQLLDVRPAPKFEIPLTLELVRPLFPATKPANIARYLRYVGTALNALHLTDWPMVCAALATIRAETEGFLPISEFQSQFNTAPGGVPFDLYGPGTGPGKRVGNTQAGDGARFKGRGFVQLTGRDNYTRYGAALRIDETSLAGRKTELRETVFYGDEFSGRTRCTSELRSAAGHEFNRVQLGSRRNRRQQERIARTEIIRVRLECRVDAVTRAQAQGS